MYGFTHGNIIKTKGWKTIMSKQLKYLVTVQFNVPSDEPSEAAVKLEALKAIGEVVKVQASATKSEE